MYTYPWLWIGIEKETNDIDKEQYAEEGGRKEGKQSNVYKSKVYMVYKPLYKQTPFEKQYDSWTEQQKKKKKRELLAKCWQQIMILVSAGKNQKLPSKKKKSFEL